MKRLILVTVSRWVRNDLFFLHERQKSYAGDALLQFKEFIQYFGLKRSFRYVNGYVDG